MYLSLLHVFNATVRYITCSSLLLCFAIQVQSADSNTQTNNAHSHTQTETEAKATQLPGELTLLEQRYTYELAKTKLKKRDFSAFHALRAQLGTYPLAPYLDYQFASKHLHPLNRGVVERFIRAHLDSYLGDRMLRQYLNVLASQAQWADLQYWYNPSIRSVALKCRWIEARYRLGDTSSLNDIAAIWVSPKSLPEQCDTVFTAWKSSEYYSDTYAWSRFMSAVDESNRGLARYLASSLPKSFQEYTDLIWALDARPHLIKNQRKFRRHTPEMQHVISFGIKKYARKHPVEAFHHWELYEAGIIFDDDISRATKITLVNRLLRKNETEAVKRLLSSSPSLRQAGAIEQLIRIQLKEQNWPEVKQTISLLPPKERASDRWQYWHTRTQVALGELTAIDAEKTYQTLAQNRSFYGFLAADIVQQNYALQAQNAAFPVSTLNALAQNPTIVRAKELWITGHIQEAQAEWFYSIDKLSARELAVAGALAHDWGWYDRGIQAMIAGKHWDSIDIRFPLAYKEHVLLAADQTRLEPSFIFAIARQESAMSEQAKSSAGARGLMQLMPSTAKQTARKNGIQHKVTDLYKADHNIALGSQYLDELLDRFNGNRILAAAAYNAGPHRVSRWTKGQAQLPYDVWIETIPFKETRGYVQNVLTYAVIYSMRMGKAEPLVTKNEAKQKL